MSFLDRLARQQFKGSTLPARVQTRASALAATGDVSYHAPNQISMPDWNAENAIHSGYLSNIYVHKCVRRIAEDMAALPFHAGPDPSVPHRFNTNAPLAKFLGPPPITPNPEMSARSLWAWSIVQYLVTGKFAWLLERDSSGQVVNIWPLMSIYLFPIRSKVPGQYFSGFKYGIPGTTAYSELKVEDVVYCYRPSAYDTKEPESVLEAARINVSVANIIDSFEEAFYRNNAVPAHIVVTPPFAEPEAKRAFQEQWRSEYGGPGNAGKAMFLETAYGEDYGDTVPTAKDSVFVAQIGTNAEDAQTSSARDSHIQDIAVAFGVPLSVLGDSTHSKFQNADMDERNYWRHTMLPLAAEIADQVNTQLAPLLGTDIGWFDTSAVASLNPDKTIKPSDPLPHVMANLITRDEARSMYGLGPWTDVDPSNLPVIVPAGLPGVLAIPGIPVTDPEQHPAPAPVPAAKTETTVPVPAPARALELVTRHAGHEHLPIPSGHLTDQTPKKFQVKAWEKLLNDALASLMEEQQAHVLGRMSGRKGRTRELYDAAYWLTRTEHLLTPISEAMALAGNPAINGRVPAGRNLRIIPQVSADLTEDIRACLDLAVTASQGHPEALPDLLGEVFAHRAEKVTALILEPFREVQATHVNYATAESLFTELSAGSLDLDAALKSLEESAA